MEWLPTPVFLHGEFHGQRSLVGCTHEVTKSQTRLSKYHLHYIYIYIYIFRFFSIIVCCKALSIVLLFTYFMGPCCLPISYIVVYFWEKAMAPHSSTLAWKIPWTEEPGRLRSIESRRVRHDWATSLSFSLSCIGEGHGNPLQCSCLENPRDRGAWWAAVYGVTQSRTRLKRLSSSSSSSVYLLIPNS